MVAITQKQRLMGTSARNQAVTNYKNTIWGFTPFLGRKYSDPVVQEEIKRVPYQVVEQPGNEIGIKVRACIKDVHDRFSNDIDYFVGTLWMCILRLFKPTMLNTVL